MTFNEFADTKYGAVILAVLVLAFIIGLNYFLISLT
jgi:hypothetical protein